MGEREIGRILEGIDNLNGRYSAQEGRLDRVEGNINDLITSFTAQPGKCLRAMEDKFVTREKFEPVESVSKIIKKASILIFCSLLTGVAVVLIYLHERLP
jgi:hypothetical protein